jgi:Trp operon repressor
MPHVSKQKLKVETANEIYAALLEVISSTPESKKRKQLLNELLTGTEKIMLAKRLAVIFLLAKKVPPYRIWNKLKISPSTVARFEVNLDKKFKNLLGIGLRHENKTRLEKMVDSLLSVSMPAKVGPRWTWLNELLDR